MEFADGMAKLGIRSDAIKSAQFKDMGSPFKHLEPDERELMQKIVDDYYTRFKSVVTGNRPITDPQVISVVTDGRVFSGTRAVELGLADQTGLLEDAIDVAKKMSHSPKAMTIMFKRPYGYSGSVYATMEPPPPQANGVHVNLPESFALEPGFYYLWRP
jgi:protease-4